MEMALLPVPAPSLAVVSYGKTFFKPFQSNATWLDDNEYHVLVDEDGFCKHFLMVFKMIKLIKLQIALFLLIYATHSSHVV